MITRDHASKYFDTMADLILDCSLCCLKNSWVVITYTFQHLTRVCKLPKEFLFRTFYRTRVPATRIASWKGCPLSATRL